MLTVLLTGTGVAVGTPAWLLGGMLLASVRPFWTLAIVSAVVVVLRSFPTEPKVVTEATYLQAVADELRAGASLPDSLAAAGTSVPALDLGALARLARAGRPARELAGVLRTRLAILGKPAGAAVQLVRELGGGGAAVFDALALVAHDEAHLAREHRIASAQARLSALVVGGLPLLFLAFLLASGRFADLFARTPQLLVVGLGLLLSGGLVMGVMLRRAHP